MFAILLTRQIKPIRDEPAGRFPLITWEWISRDLVGLYSGGYKPTTEPITQDETKGRHIVQSKEMGTKEKYFHHGTVFFLHPRSLTPSTAPLVARHATSSTGKVTFYG